MDLQLDGGITVIEYKSLGNTATILERNSNYGKKIAETLMNNVVGQRDSKRLISFSHK